MDRDAMSGGSLACVGLGMMLGAHLSPRARSHLETADVVFAAVADPLFETWLREIAKDVRSLQPYYGARSGAKSRHETYREMAEAMLAEVRAGRRVCGAFYGHPGVFAQAPHVAIAQARAEGYAAVMEPGISAEDCLYADLGIDPGRFGCQHHEASQLMFHRRRLDPTAYLVLWQVGIAGDRSHRRFETDPARLAILVDVLAADWPRTHEGVLYEAATLPIHPPRIETVRLGDLPSAVLSPRTTLVLPPAAPLQHNRDVLARLDALDEAPPTSDTPGDPR